MTYKQRQEKNMREEVDRKNKEITEDNVAKNLQVDAGGTQRRENHQGCQ
jgi:hypothetical protein